MYISRSQFLDLLFDLERFSELWRNRPNPECLNAKLQAIQKIPGQVAFVFGLASHWLKCNADPYGPIGPIGPILVDTP